MEKKKFDQKEYNKKYKKEHYKTVNTFMTFDLYDEIMDVVDASGMARSEWMRQAVIEKLEQSK